MPVRADDLSLEAQVRLLAGASFWLTHAVPEAGIPAIKVSDGPNGARGGGALVGGVSAASFPVGIALGATWNVDLLYEIGAALADEAKSKGAKVLLGPTVNLHRGALNGRNFECFSEDPYLSAQLAAAYICGLQNSGVSACVKHFVGNESEYQRTTISSDIPERALRELYLYPFEVAVKEAKVWAVMCAYNKLNGTFASENRRLLTEVLRAEWGFDGVVLSDWFATHSTAAGLLAGLDLEMPGPPKYRGEKLLAAVKNGEVAAATVRQSAARLLRWLERVDAFKQPEMAEEKANDNPAHRLLIRRAGAEGAVLLKNNGALPLTASRIDRLAVIGPNAKTAQIMGGGSSQLNAHYRISPFAGLAAALGEARLSYALGCRNDKYLPLLDAAVEICYFNSPDLTGAVIYQETHAGSHKMWLDPVGNGVAEAFSARLETVVEVSKAGVYEVELLSAGLSRLLIDGVEVLDNWGAWEQGESYFGSGSVPKIAAVGLEPGSHSLCTEFFAKPAGDLSIFAVRLGWQKRSDEDLLAAAEACAAAADAVILCVGLNGDWETEGEDRVHMDLVGEQNALISRVAAVNPNTIVLLQTGSPVTMPWLAEVAAVVQLWYPGQECGNAAADVLLGVVDPSGRLPQSFPARLEDSPIMEGDPSSYPGKEGHVSYREGLQIGYRHFDRADTKPLFPFGFGLSYARFSYHNLHLSAATLRPGEVLKVTLEVSNTGSRAGQEVVQLYVRDVKAALRRPEKELKGFVKLTLSPGERKEAVFTLDMRALAYFDEAKNLWVAEAGRYEVLVASSSADIRLGAPCELLETWQGSV